MTTQNIYQRINTVMKAVSYVQKDKSVSGMGAGYKAVTHDQLVSVVREHIVKAGIVLTVSQTRGHYNEKGKKWDKDAKQEVPDTMRLYEGEYDVTLINADDPSDKVAVHVEAHAMDNGDKAPGKAMTYATKTAMLKLFWLETGENDESRAGPSSEIDVDEVKLLIDKANDKSMLKALWTEWAGKCAKAKDTQAWADIKASLTVRSQELGE